MLRSSERARTGRSAGDVATAALDIEISLLDGQSDGDASTATPAMANAERIQRMTEALRQQRAHGAVVEETAPDSDSDEEDVDRWETPDLLQLFGEAYEKDSELANDQQLPQDVVALDRLRLKRVGRGDPATDRYYIIVPKDEALRRALIMTHHDNPFRGHPGREKLTAELTAQFHWPGLKEDLMDYLRGCTECNANKKANSKGQGAVKPFDVRKPGTVGMDYVTSLPTSRTGNDTILTTVDLYTKKVRLVACKAKGHGAKEFCRVFTDQIRPAFGDNVEVFLSDRDPKFTAAFTQECNRLLGIVNKFTSGGWSRGNGQAERTNQTVEQLLRLFTSADQASWDEHLAAVELVINNTIASATGFSPNLVHNGVPSPKLLERLRHHIPATFEEYSRLTGIDDPAAYSHLGRMVDAVRLAGKALEEARRRMERWHKSARNQLVYKPGDKVWLSAAAFQSMKLRDNQSAKLSPRWYGPFTVTAVMTNAVKIELPARMRCHPVFNVSYVRPAYASKLFPRKQTQLILPNVDPNSIVTNEPAKITGVRSRRGKSTEYKVAWRGLASPAEDTWVDSYLLRQQVPGMVRDFEKTRAPEAPQRETLLPLPREKKLLAAVDDQDEDDGCPCIICGIHRSHWQGRGPFIYCDGPGELHGAHIRCVGKNRVPRGKWYCFRCEQRRAAGDAACDATGDAAGDAAHHATGGAAEATTGDAGAAADGAALTRRAGGSPAGGSPANTKSNMKSNMRSNMTQSNKTVRWAQAVTQETQIAAGDTAAALQQLPQEAERTTRRSPRQSAPMPGRGGRGRSSTQNNS
jgi:hypothetical protein